MNLLHATICKHRAQVLQHCSRGLFTWNLVVIGRLHSLRALKWDFLALRRPETEPMSGSWPSYLRDLLCDVLRAVLHLGGAEQLHPGSGRRAAFVAPAGWSHTPYKVRVRHGALLAIRWSEKHICIYIYIKEILRNLCFYSFFSSIFRHLYSWCSFLGLRMLIPLFKIVWKISTWIPKKELLSDVWYSAPPLRSHFPECKSSSAPPKNTLHSNAGLSQYLTHRVLLHW